ncbi:chitooligosaccharidolytic beta-N-acetylglucosaminidase [Anthonomus grandis grandis]|uniref:chitooligosaccharidolytic beta-N-acetylglucosaminidase n=1 Tax=Anthonomus grandis grandis TaxID=2921223 RepID=UPI002166320F|nr:chitooligosaccharidolytic beta-N-acetylglucosaminidase [Anthonomus grandis grandis]
MPYYSFLSAFLTLSSIVNVQGWIWECYSGSCVREHSIDESFNKSQVFPSVEICRLVCGSNGPIWPKPSLYEATDKALIFVNAKNAVIHFSTSTEAESNFLREVESYFMEAVNKMTEQQNCQRTQYKLVISLNSKTPSLHLNWMTEEKYDLHITTDEDTKTLRVRITGETVFGVRHGVESLLQLIELFEDNEQTCFISQRGVNITDQPYYRHRGLLIDSGRNFLSVETIKRNIDGMALSKMNVLHWHLTDTQSFPFVSARLPNMSIYGAYSGAQTYSAYQITDLIQYAKVRGIRIIPEIDGPAHAGSGWQWGPEASLGNLVVCYNQQPYRSYCIQPPCGQMNPANQNLYFVLQNLYADLIDLWTESDVFHMGGDEVYTPCWNSTEEIVNYLRGNRSEEAFLNLWAEYQEKALNAFDIANHYKNSSVILWTSSLTDPSHIEQYLPKDRYIIQTWVPTSDTLPEELLNLGYKLIISTKDSWYLDHGFWGTTTYYTWRKVYDNKILTSPSVLGGEVCMWGELVDDNNIESRAWPRAAAAAERLWSNPSTPSTAASSRFFAHTDRLIKKGIKASPVVPGFCSVSEADCATYL